MPLFECLEEARRLQGMSDRLGEAVKDYGVDDGIRTRDSRSHSPELYP